MDNWLGHLRIFSVKNTIKSEKTHQALQQRNLES